MNKIKGYSFLKLFFCVCGVLFFNGLNAQEPSNTIRVRKVQNLKEAVFDNTEYRLMVIDRFGNPKDNQIVTYTLYVKTKKSTESFQGYTNSLTSEMIAFLNKQKEACKIFFTGIEVKDDEGHLVKLPDVIEVWFPNIEKRKKK